MIPGPEKAEGNDDIVAIFEHALSLAKEGRLVSACLVACEKRGALFRAATGLPGMELQMRRGLESLDDHYKQLLIERETRPIQRIDTADYVCWSLRDLPYSYDYVCALVDAEMTRVREGAPAPLKFCFYGEAARPTEYSSQFYNSVMQPALTMIGAVIDPRALSGRQLRGHQIRAIVEASLRGEKVPRLQPSSHGLAAAKERYSGCITLTLREAEHWPHRNSNLPEWLRFADYLTGQGHRVVVVRDTAKASEPIDGYDTCPIASLNLDARLSLYEAAKCNIFASSGAFGMALFGSRPWLCFQYLSEEDLYEPNRPSWWAENYGMTEGMQFPWSRPDQRLVWCRDDADLMIEAWQHYATMPLAA